MDLTPQFCEIVQDISKEVQGIKLEMERLRCDGLLDEGLEGYLLNAIEELRSRKELLVDQFLCDKNVYADCYSKRLEVRSATTQAQYDYTSSLEKYNSSTPEPFVNQCPIKTLPTIIFKKKISPLRGNSPSAQRYTSKSPCSEKIGKSFLDHFSNTDSQISSTRSSRSSFERGNVNNTEQYALELSWKFIQQREIRNKAHEEELNLKEKMLKEMEIRLQKLKSEVVEECEENQVLRINVSKVKDDMQGKQFVKPPRSPRMLSTKTDKNDKKIVRNI